jgi:hypothetical protein
MLMQHSASMNSLLAALLRSKCWSKNVREYSILNCCAVFITTNHKQDGIYLPAEDRRHFVAWSDRKKQDFDPDYWTKMWKYYDRGGDRHVAAYLAGLDLSTFDPKAPPPRTEAFWAIANGNRSPEDAELADALDKLRKKDKSGKPGPLPDAVTLTQVINVANSDFEEWLRDRKNRRQIPFRFEQCGYLPVRNPDRDTGLWVVKGVRQVIHAKAALSPRDRLAAANEHARQ